MATGEVPFEPLQALLAGVLSALIVIFGILVMLAVAPKRFPLNPLYITGSAVSIDTTRAYLSGIVIALITGAGYGVFVAAVLTGFDVERLETAWGAVAGVVLAIITGTTLAYARSLNRAVRAGYVGDPGPFAVSYGRWTVAQIVAAHVVFGAITATLYIVLK